MLRKLSLYNRDMHDYIARLSQLIISYLEP